MGGAIVSNACLLAMLGATVKALAFAGPKATDVVYVPPDAQSPRPTTAPSLRELKRRADESTFLVGPDNTCGYLSGLAGAQYTCNGANAKCVFLTAAGGLPGALGCCDGTDCGFRLTCVDSAQISASSCDNGCKQDTFTVKCSESTAQFCNTLSFSGSVMDYFCNSLNISTPQAASTTFSGQTGGRSYSELVVTDTASIPSISSSRSTTTSSDASNTTSPGSQPAGGDGGGGGGGASANAGAIAGGVVGGVAVIGLLVLGLLFLLRHNKKKPGQAATETPQPGTPGVPPMAQGHQSFYGGTPDPSKAGQQPFGSPTPPQPYGAAYNAPPDQQHPSSLMPGQHTPDRRLTASPMSSAGDYNRMSQAGAMPSPTSGNYGHLSQQSFPGHNPAAATPPVIYEAGGNAVGSQNYNNDHRGQMHELG